ncbi:venom carboxylesterase-6-like [Daphnia pulex]|uniref:venom carboxylesterase-6-like n=1 Tax=Daphnia pulex TaxID=6669 RepID=UPI001EDDC451|nr:venom carboxylesterase-6-like [Daphnia pulex]
MKLKLYLVVLVLFFEGKLCDLFPFDDPFFESEPVEPVGPVATIPTLGQVRGSQMTSQAGRSFYAFRGIPYAKPPVGDLRFSDPLPVDPWLGETLDVTREGPTCIQYNTLVQFILGKEDCLKLNIYTHDLDFANSTRAVMVWIHGGSWFMSSGNGGLTDIYGPRYLLDRDIVLVTINYRLGPFGFLTTEDAEAPGNYGLLDQSMALRWIRDHIRYFGGNPDAVTIFGESSGAASVQHHLLSPHSKGLFHRAIAQSGSALNPWSIEKSVGEYSRLLAKDLDCLSSNSSEVLSCLRNKPARELAIFRKKIEVFKIIPIAFGPRIDTERELPFIPDEPKNLIEQKQINEVPLIMGLNENEGAFTIAMLLSNNGTLLRNFNEDPLKYLRSLSGVEFTKNGDQVFNRIVEQYFTPNKTFENQLTELEQMISDYAFFKGIDDAVHLFSKFSDQPTYYYLFGHRGQLSVTSLLGLSPDLNLGVSHTDELYFMFTNDFLPRLNSTNDITVSKLLLDLWTTFAQDGVPQSDLVNGGWCPIEVDQTQYLKIDAEYPAMMNQSMPFHDRLAFWNQDFNPSTV